MLYDRSDKVSLVQKSESLRLCSRRGNTSVFGSDNLASPSQQRRIAYNLSKSRDVLLLDYMLTVRRLKLTTEKQRAAARGNITKAQAKCKSMSRQERPKAPQVLREPG